MLRFDHHERKIRKKLQSDLLGSFVNRKSIALIIFPCNIIRSLELLIDPALLLGVECLDDISDGDLSEFRD
jgi:hypothetical protein